MKLFLEMAVAAFIGLIISAAFWLMDWNYLFGFTYVWVLIGITLSIGKKLDR
jgi:hypothetical protein